MAKSRCRFGRVKSGPRKGRCRKQRRESTLERRRRAGKSMHGYSRKHRKVRRVNRSARRGLFF